MAGPDGEARAQITLALISALDAISTQIAALNDHIREQLTLHPDAATFTNLPRAGQIRAARLLAEIGDARGRFPTPESLVCLAGVAPVLPRPPDPAVADVAHLPFRTASVVSVVAFMSLHDIDDLPGALGETPLPRASSRWCSTGPTSTPRAPRTPSRATA